MLLFAGEAGVQEAFHSGRPDFVAIDLALLSLLILISISASQKGFRTALLRSFLLGVSASAAALSHLAVGVYAFASFLGVLLASARLNGRDRLGIAAVCLAGAMLPLLCWIALVGVDGSLWRSQIFNHIVGATTGSRTQTGDLSFLLNPVRHLFQYFKSAPHIVFVAVVAIWASGWHGLRRFFSDSRLMPVGVFVAGGLLLLFAAENFVKFLFPSLLIGVSCLMMLPEASDYLRSRPRLWRALSATGLLGALLVPSARLIAVVTQWTDRSPAPLASLVRDNIPENSTVAGVSQAYFAVRQNGSKFLYSTALQGVRVDVTPQDQSRFEQSILTEHPHFALLSSKDDPSKVLGFIRPAGFTELGAVKSNPLSLKGFASKVGYDIVLWRIDYTEPHR